MFKLRVWAIVKEEQSELQALLQPLSLSFSVSLLLGWSTEISERHRYSSKQSFLYKIKMVSNRAQFFSNTWMTNDLAEKCDILALQCICCCLRSPANSILRQMFEIHVLLCVKVTHSFSVNWSLFFVSNILLHKEKRQKLASSSKACLWFTLSHCPELEQKSPWAEVPVGTQC